MSYQDLFWHVWEENMPRLATSIVKYAMGPYRYRGDPQDVVQEVMLSAYLKWNDYDREASAFSTWVLMLTKQYLSSLYNTLGTGRGPGLGNRPIPRYKLISLDSGVQPQPEFISTEPLIEFVSDGKLTPEEVVITNEERVQICTTMHELFLAHRETRKGRILEAMAALIDEDLKPSTRLIAEMVGCSHGTVATELKEIREWLSSASSEH